MANLRQQDLVRSIGDTLTELDVLLSSPTLSSTDFKSLRRQRRDLDAMQRKLVVAQFAENTERFQEAARGLKTVNDELRERIANVEATAGTIAATTQVIDAIGKLLSLAGT